jgi:iron complex outermembrane recepter protein
MLDQPVEAAAFHDGPVLESRTTGTANRGKLKMKELKARHARSSVSRLFTEIRSGCTRRSACHALLATIVALAPAVSIHADEAPAKPATADNSGADSLQEITVTGYLYSLETSEKAKKQSAEVIEVISPEDLGKFTDNSIADALQRVPGVQIDRDTDGRSGSHVAIDGMGAEFVTTTVNGRTPGGYGHEGLYQMRQFPVDVFPGEILSGTVIYKTASAELVESGLGGEIDFQTLKPLEYKPKSGENYFGSLTVKGQNNSNGSSTDLNYSNGLSGKGLSGIVGGKFLDNTLGFYVSGTVSSNKTTEDSMEQRPQYQTVNVQNSAGVVNQQNVLFPSLPLYQNIRRDEDRRAISTALQWDPIDSVDVNLDYTYSLYNRIENRDVLGVNENSGGTFLPGGISIQDGAVTGLNYNDYTPAPGTTGSGVSEFFYPLIYNHSATAQIGGLNAKWQGERLSFATDFSLNTTNFFENLADAYIPVSSPTLPSATTNYNVNPDGPSSFNAGTPPITSASQFTGQYYLGEKFIHTTNDGGAFKLDAAYKFSDDTKLKLGTRYAETEVDARVYNYNGNALTPAQQAVAEGLIFPGGVDNIFPGFNIGGSNAQPHQNFAGYLADNAQLGYIPPINLNQAPFTGPFAGAGATYGAYAPDLTQNHANQEKTLAEYGQLDTKGSLFSTEYSGNVGLRVVHTNETAQGFEGVSYVNIDNNPTRTLPPTLVQSHNSYTDFLPSANLTFFPWPDIDFRFGVGRTVSRPEYIDMSPIASIFVPDLSLPGTAGQKGLVTTGNPALKPETAWNYNWTVDYYAPRGGSFIVSAFYKAVSDFIAPITVANATLPSYPGQLFTLTTPENVSSGKAYGTELGFNLPLRNYLPALNGFGVQANYTYVESVINASLDPSHPGTSPFPGASKNSVNGTAYFSRDPWEFRVAVVHRSDYLSSFPVLPQTAVPIYTEGSTVLDMSVNYAIAKNLTATFTGSNLTGANRRDYAYSRAAVLNYYTIPTILALSLRGSF